MRTMRSVLLALSTQFINFKCKHIHLLIWTMDMKYALDFGIGADKYCIHKNWPIKPVIIITFRWKREKDKISIFQIHGISYIKRDYFVCVLCTPKQMSQTWLNIVIIIWFERKYKGIKIIWCNVSKSIWVYVYSSK